MKIYTVYEGKIESLKVRETKEMFITEKTYYEEQNMKIEIVCPTCDKFFRVEISVQEHKKFLTWPVKDSMLNKISLMKNAD